MQILGLLGMYFDAVVVFVTNSSLLVRFSVAILCGFTIRIKKSYTPIAPKNKIRATSI